MLKVKVLKKSMVIGNGWTSMTWEYWCKKNDCILYIYDKPKYSDLKRVLG